MDELYFENSDVSLVDRDYNIRYTDILHAVCKLKTYLFAKAYPP